MDQSLKDQKKNKPSLQFQPSRIKKAWLKIQQAKKITLLTHFRPDGDAVSSCAALSYILNKLNKKVETIYPNKPELAFKRNPKNLIINKHKQKPDLLIALDTANYERMYFPKEFAKIPLINIDHHISNSLEGTIHFIKKETSSTCEILFELIKAWDIKLIDKYAAECLLIGILYDSLIFHTQSTYPSTLRISADLMDLGANLYKLKTEITANKNPKIINLWGNILSSIKITKNKKAVWACITQNDLIKHNLELNSLIGFSNFLSQIAQIDITLLFYEMKSGETKVSLRSKKTDVNKLAAKFGGGGHKNAAGIVSDIPIKKLAKEITNLL